MYLDPAFGGMLVQILAVVAAVGGGIIFSFRRKIRLFFSKDKKNETAMKDISPNEEKVIDMLETINMPETPENEVRE